MRTTWNGENNDVQLASCVLSLVKESYETRTASGDSFCPVGDVVLFGSMERLKFCSDIEEIYLDHRVKRIGECLGPVTENERLKEKQHRNENEGERTISELKSFVEFVQERFSSFAPPLRRCIVTFCTHISRSFMGENNFRNMISFLESLGSLEYLLTQKNLASEEVFKSKPLEDYFVKSCLSSLKTLQTSIEGLVLPCFSNKYALKQFCFERAFVIFCTTSISYKLNAVNMEPLNIVVIDEAAQLTEAESTIPLQLPGMKHDILVGDERQLPAMVNSNVCIESGFGRSLFDRLSSLGHSKHLFRPMFRSYSFINVVGGREEKDDDGRSRRNMVEVAIVVKIVRKLYTSWQDSNKKTIIGVISLYAAQVVSIQEKLGHKYEKLDGFSVKVKSIDGFQGGGEDIIILSTVKSNSHGYVGFISSRQRTNVSLTRARHCLWILGNERTLTNSESIWNELVSDARNRHCFFDADDDKYLRMTIIEAKEELQQPDDLVNRNSVLFKQAKWKVLFSD
uniref:UvrD-like helicase, ATP-binding domain, P-loop containing nucleoside triphosphate hydrolase n=1 Tax=Tanacetum cinerariifolium TaxID=118510 RepID=A0A6L2N4K8_TANCI|nr:UvrD-like helicase, ATP-binding domain, P-loop containing nucleoside triphosphate hydrolase [Tanacetum cinerariifolium]